MNTVGVDDDGLPASGFSSGFSANNRASINLHAWDTTRSPAPVASNFVGTVVGAHHGNLELLDNLGALERKVGLEAKSDSYLCGTLTTLGRCCKTCN